MATTTNIARRHARALNQAQSLTRALAAKFNLQIAPRPVVRDKEAAQVALIENLVSVLGQVAIATETIKAEDLEKMAEPNFGQTTPEGNGPAQPNEDGLDPSMPEGAKETKTTETKQTESSETKTADKPTAKKK